VRDSSYLVPNEVKTLWDLFKRFFKIRSDADYFWFPGDAIWVALPAEKLKNLTPPSLSSKDKTSTFLAAMDTACRFSEYLAGNLGSIQHPVKLAFSLGTAKKIPIGTNSRNRSLHLWHGHGLNLAGRALELYPKGKSTFETGLIPFTYEAPTCLVEDILKLNPKKSNKLEFHPVRVKKHLYSGGKWKRLTASISFLRADEPLGQTALRGLSNDTKFSYLSAFISKSHSDYSQFIIEPDQPHGNELDLIPVLEKISKPSELVRRTFESNGHPGDRKKFVLSPGKITFFPFDHGESGTKSYDDLMRQGLRYGFKDNEVYVRNTQDGLAFRLSPGSEHPLLNPNRTLNQHYLNDEDVILVNTTHRRG